VYSGKVGTGNHTPINNNKNYTPVYNKPKKSTSNHTPVYAVGKNSPKSQQNSLKKTQKK
jgi:hypothetical protein